MNAIVMQALYEAFSEQWNQAYKQPHDRLKQQVWEWNVAKPRKRFSKKLLIRAAEILASRIEE